MSTCETNSSSCQPSSTEICPTERKESCCITDNIVHPSCMTEQTVEKLAKTFPHAIRGVMFDILKEKIRKSWGPMMEKEADAFLKATQIHWEAAFKTNAASKELRENLKKIMAEAK